jgi:hypothetical protein
MIREVPLSYSESIATESPISKVLVLDDNPTFAWRIKHFCDDNSLVALKVRQGAAMAVLRSNIDLGGILIAEDYAGTPAQTIRIAREIRAARPELPIILRRASTATIADLPDEAQSLFCAAYVAEDMGALKRVIDEFIFCMIYPNALLRGISEITSTALRGQFKKLLIAQHTPCIVHDRVIFGELMSLIQIESHWCRGYMMLQTQEKPLLEILGQGHGGDPESGFRSVNDLLGEVTNLIWGAFKNRYIGDASRKAASPIQVPLIVNHKHRYISFGTEKPQLCFRYTLSDDITGRSFALYERFVFNVSWSPEDFSEVEADVAGLVAAGELELF